MLTQLALESFCTLTFADRVARPSVLAVEVFGARWFVLTAVGVGWIDNESLFALALVGAVSVEAVAGPRVALVGPLQTLVHIIIARLASESGFAYTVAVQAHSSILAVSACSAIFNLLAFNVAACFANVSLFAVALVAAEEVEAGADDRITFVGSRPALVHVVFTILTRESRGTLAGASRHADS